MSRFVDGLKSLFMGPDTSAMDAERAKQQEQQSLALERQRQDIQNNAGQQDQQLARASRLPRGRRLLLAATGESGVSDKLGG